MKSGRRKREDEKWIGCLCRFWDRKGGAKEKNFGILTSIWKDWHGKRVYFCNNCEDYHYCRPARPEEVKFYEGEKE